MKAYFDKKQRLAEAEAAKMKNSPAAGLVSVLTPAGAPPPTIAPVAAAPKREEAR